MFVVGEFCNLASTIFNYVKDEVMFLVGEFCKVATKVLFLTCLYSWMSV
jgi:hypothetical protein